MFPTSMFVGLLCSIVSKLLANPTYNSCSFFLIKKNEKIKKARMLHRDRVSPQRGLSFLILVQDSGGCIILQTNTSKNVVSSV